MNLALPSSWRHPRRAFTLVELLVVLAIGAILAAVSVPAFLQISQASILTTASNQVMDQLTFARQEALSLNQQVEVCFYKLPSPNNSAVSIYRGMQSFALYSTGTKALTHPIYFPAQVQMAVPGTATSTTVFSALPGGDQTGPFGTISLPSVGTTYNYSAFIYRSDGSINVTTPICITLYLVNKPPSGSTLPKNWFTVQIDPLSGRLETFRP